MAPGDEEDDGLSPLARGMQTAQPYLNAVWKLVGGAAFGVIAGLMLDRWLGTRPWMLVGASTLGISAGFYGFIRAMLQLGKK